MKIKTKLKFIIYHTDENSKAHQHTGSDREPGVATLLCYAV